MGPLDFLKNTTPKQLGVHLYRYSDLFIRPVFVWRKIISYRKDGYDLFVLHLIYFTIILFFVLGDMQLAIPMVALEVIVTIIPLSFFLLPFLFYTRIFRKKIRWNRLFHLFMIFKLQTIPILIILQLLIKWSNAEFFFLIIENLLCLIWILCIVVLPLLLTLKFWQRILWILTNYVTFLIFYLLIWFATIKLPELERLLHKLRVSSPSIEFDENVWLNKISSSHFD
jgi:hypothetical protein